MVPHGDSIPESAIEPRDCPSPTVHRACPIASARVAFGLLQLVNPALAQIPETLPPPGALKRLSLEQLSITASAIQIISDNDFRGSGVSSVPEAPRLAPNLQVAQASSGQHIEFNSSPSAREVQRGVYGRITWR
jgi:hypothetical protein